MHIYIYRHIKQILYTMFSPVVNEPRSSDVHPIIAQVALGRWGPFLFQFTGNSGFVFWGDMNQQIHVCFLGICFLEIQDII